MKIRVNEKITLTKIYKKDKRQLAERINHPGIANNTLTIPHPYTLKDADFFLELINGKQKETGQQFNWAIRHEEDGFIGSIGLLGGIALGNPTRDAFGYWLWEKYWGKGIMTAVVKKFSDYCLNERGLSRLEANVFEYNTGSMRVLEKAGFEREGYLKKAYYKNDQFINGYLFAKIN